MRDTISAKKDSNMLRFLDIVFSIVTLILLSTPMLIITLAIVLYDGKPIIFRQIRIGKDCKPFTILKFRSMRNAPPEENSGVVEGVSLEDKKKARAKFQTTQVNDPRITPVGRFIRKTHLDELPQILNVLRGDMSLVGVRPDTPSQETDYYPGYWIKRHVFRPGITGTAQIYHKSGGIEARSASEKIWLEERSVKLYIIILIKSAAKVLKANSS